MLRILLPIVLFLAACSQTGGRPEAVLLENDRVTVRMSSGSPCVGFRDASTQTATGWAGTLEGCPMPYPYKVTLQPGTNPVRWVLQETFTALGGDNIVAPLALVEVTAPGGVIYRFRSPASR